MCNCAVPARGRPLRSRTGPLALEDRELHSLKERRLRRLEVKGPFACLKRSGPRIRP